TRVFNALWRDAGRLSRMSRSYNRSSRLRLLDMRMREAAADLDFKEAARMRDEIKRLRVTETARVRGAHATPASMKWAPAWKRSRIARAPPAAAAARGRGPASGGRAPSDRSASEYCPGSRSVAAVDANAYSALASLA